MKMTLTLDQDDLERAIADYVFKVKRVIIQGKPSGLPTSVTIDVEEPKPIIMEL